MVSLLLQTNHALQSIGIQIFWAVQAKKLKKFFRVIRKETVRVALRHS